MLDIVARGASLKLAARWSSSNIRPHNYGDTMGMYFGSAKEKREYEIERRLREDQAAAEEDRARREFAAKIVMTVVDKIVTDIIRPGPNPEERECYEMAGEVRALVPDLEKLVAKIIENETK